MKEVVLRSNKLTSIHYKQKPTTLTSQLNVFTKQEPTENGLLLHNTLGGKKGGGKGMEESRVCSDKTYSVNPSLMYHV